jgi:membrane protease YdiL (CAAX protease family)
LGISAAGAALGLVLGAHLLVTASLTLGYGVRVPTPGHLAPWLAYDAGANVLTTEAFFRGALLDRAQRRWSFALASVSVTILCLARYFLDPLLPHSLEVAAGAVFYLTLLSLGNCWMYWRSGSIVPGILAGVTFFACYRLLHVVP